MEVLKQFFESILLGIIQGVTEFLPVSSSGHLAIFKNILGMKDVGISFDILLHVGTLIAVFIVYWKDIARLFYDGIGIVIDACANVGVFFKRNAMGQRVKYRRVISSSYRKFAMLVIVSTIPTGIIGIIGKDFVEEMSSTLIVPGICLIITGLLLMLSDKLPDGSKTPKKTTYKDAVFVGICQGIATLPGISRSGTTITAEILCGFRRDFAVKYSFIMSIPVILGAAVLDLKDFGSEGLSGTTLASYIVGMIAAAVVGYICIKTMLVIVRKKKFSYFSYYCFAVGAIAILWYFGQIIMS